MSRDVSSFVPEVTAWTRNFDDFSSNFQLMARKLKELDQQLQDTTAELNNERESRKNWMKRANEVETRQTQQQFILMLMDGNQSFFKDEIIRSGAAESAVQSLITEVHETAKSKHKNDLTSDIRIVLHTFVDFDRLLGDLVSAGSLSARKQLEEFTKALTASTPSLSFTDCGPGRQGVNAKLKHFYELFIENVQCRHIILALGPDSEYYATLDMFSEDAYTLGKTSLVRTEHGFPSKYNLPFHQVEFSSIGTVPLISLGEHSEGRPAEESREIQTAASPQLWQAAGSASSAVPSQHSQTARSSEGSSGSKGEASGSGPDASPPSSQTSHAVSSSSKPSLAPKLLSEPSISQSHVSALPEPSAYEASRPSCEHAWERSTGDNTYAPPACTVPWGEEQDTSENIGDPSNHPTQEDHRLPCKGHAAAHQRNVPPRRNDRPFPTQWTNSTLNAPRIGPTSFKGGWDDLVSGQVEPASAMQVPASPSSRSSGSGKLPELPIQGKVALNRHGDRIDLPLPPLSMQDKQRLTSRTKDRKLCNEHQIRRACHNSQCRYDHEPVDAGILLALRHLARTQACSVGTGCRMFECCYGHHCPYRAGGNECKNAKCSFKKMSLHHVQDLKVAKMIPAPRK